MVVPPQHQQSRRHQCPAAQRNERRSQQDGQNNQDFLNAFPVCRRGKGVGQTSVFGHGERRHRQPREAALQHQRQRPAQPHPGGEADAERNAEIREEVGAEPDDGKGPAAGVF